MKIRHHPSYRDLTGLTFGSLTVLRDFGRTKDRKIKWLCKCTCGNDRIVITYYLVHKKVVKCKECYKSKGPLGKKFGILKVVKKHKSIRVGTAQKIMYIYKCLCDCGKTTYVRASNLYGKQVKSCGCLQGKTLPTGEAAKRRIFDTYKRGAKQRKIKFDLSLDQASSIFKQNCYYCNQRPSNKVFSNHEVKKHNGNYIYSGIDRINNDEGYNIDNVVPCCKTCNYAKRNLTVKVFLKWIKAVYNHSIKQIKDA